MRNQDPDAAYEGMRERSCDEAHEAGFKLKRPMDYLIWRHGGYSELNITTHETEVEWSYCQQLEEDENGVVLIGRPAEISQQVHRLTKLYPGADNVYINGVHEDDE
jgi:hypothetical protein